MSSFSPQHYRRIGHRLGIDHALVEKAVAVAERIIADAPDRAVVFTLRHLAALSGVPYRVLRDWVGRWGPEPYRQFFVAKKADARRRGKAPTRPRRRIASPAPPLLRQQRWLVERVLHHAPRHPSSMAFHRKADVVESARLHCGCRWLIKMDIRDFFESIYEPKVFEVFVSLGYPRLLAFELTRLCTRIVPRGPGESEDVRRFAAFSPKRGVEFYDRVADANTALGGHAMRPDDRRIERRIGAAGAGVSILPMGSLPQGAPTSPLLANLAVRDLDSSLTSISAAHGLVYTRYADDIALSTVREDFSREEAKEVIGEVLRAFEREGLHANHAKTRLMPPGARKIVLGLVVDGARPRLSREYRNKLRLHAHILGNRGIAPSAHAAALRFRSVLSMRRHIEGKIAHARRVEPDFADGIAAAIARVNWTL